MQKIAIGLSALLLIAAATKPGAAQDATAAGTAQRAECAEYFGCLDYGTLSPAQARTCRGHPQFMEPRTAAAPPARQVVATPVRVGQPPGSAATARQ